MSYYGQSDFFLDVKLGLVPKYSSFKISGVNPDVDTAEEFINNLNALNFPTTYRIHSFRSSSVNDTLLGTGARTLKVTGNTSSGIESEIINMNGISSVSTTKSFDFIIEIEVETAGTTTKNEGTITGTANVDATSSIQMIAGEGECYNGAFKCPLGHTAYLLRWWGDAQNSTANTTVDFHLWKHTGSAWHIEEHAKSVNQGSSDFNRDYHLSGLKLDAGETFAVKALSSNNNSDVDTGFIIILIQD